MSPRQRIIPVFVPHLGCPNCCVFCNQRKISGSEKAPDARELRLIIEDALEKNPGRDRLQLAFYGGSFTAIPLGEQTELLEGALPFLRSGAVDSLRVSTRPDAIDPEILDRLERYGVRTIELGAQSMSPEVLAASGRGHSPEDTERAARLIKRRGFQLILQMMTGLPEDTEERSIATAEKLIALEPDGVRIYPTVVLRDTPLYELWQSGRYSPHTVEQAVDWCAAIVPLFEAAEIPIIRLGLNPSEKLSRGQAAAGAYHPALGELVRSRVLLNRALALLEDFEPDSRAALVLGVNPSDVSAMIGQRRANIRALSERLGLSQIRVRPRDIPRGQVEIL